MDKIIYINMDNRPDRRSALLQEFKRVGFAEDQIIRFPASSYNGCPNSGCLLSHANALEMAYDNGFQNVLILEDDFVFIDDVTKIHSDIRAFFEMNLSWDVLMFTTCSPVILEYTNDLVSRISSSSNGAGYLVNRSMMLELSTLFKSNVENLYNSKQHWVYQNDILWKTIMPMSQWYMFNHYLGYQKEGYSDLSNDQKIAIIPQVVETLQVMPSSLQKDEMSEVYSEPSVVNATLQPELLSSENKKEEISEAMISEAGISEEIPPLTSDSIVNNVINSFVERSNIGLQKYGTTLDREDLSLLDWIQHAQEEHMDAILYLEKLKIQYKKEHKK